MSHQPDQQPNTITADSVSAPSSVPGAQTDIRTSLNAKSDNMPPKKPLTPYMKFSKSVSNSVALLLVDINLTTSCS